jgi:hypothetical protein
LITLINGHVQGPNNVAVANGSISLQLQSDSQVIASPFGQVEAGIPVTFKFDANGNMPASAQIWSNAELTPSGTSYLVNFYDQNGARTNVTPMVWIFSQGNGSTVDIGTIVSASPGSPAYAQAVITSPIAQQTINGQDLVMEGSALGFSAPASTTGDVFLSRQAANVAQIGTTDANAAGTLRTAIYQVGGSDTGLSRDSAGVVDVGNGTAGDHSGIIQLLSAFFSSLGIVKWSIDTGLSRISAGLIGVGNGTQGDFSAAIKTTSPVINGTPSGTGIPTVTLKKGSGSGNYTTASTSYVQIDGTNLSYTVTIPTGWKLAIAASGGGFTSTAAVFFGVALADNIGGGGANVISETTILAASTSNSTAWALNWVINGDGASHVVDLRFKTSNGADSVNIQNNTSTVMPTMVFFLSPSN